MRFAYADPPYLGCGKKHYRNHHAEASIWDDPEAHRKLIERLRDEWPDGWALSASASSLPVLIPMLPSKHRICVWVKTFAVFRVNVGVAYAWEPVILVGGRLRTRQQRTIRDWFEHPVILQGKVIPGAKPPGVVHWMLDLLNVQVGDEVTDLFPGSGIVGKCVAARVTSRPTLDDLPLGLANG